MKRIRVDCNETNPMRLEFFNELEHIQRVILLRRTKRIETEVLIADEVPKVLRHELASFCESYNISVIYEMPTKKQNQFVEYPDDIAITQFDVHAKKFKDAFK